MAKKEVKTDLWVWELLKQADIKLEAQGSTILEIDNALKTASKKRTGKVGFPEYVGVVKDYLLVIEDKADLSKHIKLDDGGVISQEVQAVTDYAVNGAVFYGKHLGPGESDSGSVLAGSVCWGRRAFSMLTTGMLLTVPFSIASCARMVCWSFASMAESATIKS